MSRTDLINYTCEDAESDIEFVFLIAQNKEAIERNEAIVRFVKHIFGDGDEIICQRCLDYYKLLRPGADKILESISVDGAIKH